MKWFDAQPIPKRFTHQVNPILAVSWYSILDVTPQDEQPLEHFRQAVAQFNQEMKSKMNKMMQNIQKQNEENMRRLNEQLDQMQNDMQMLFGNQG